MSYFSSLRNSKYDFSFLEFDKSKAEKRLIKLNVGTLKIKMNNDEVAFFDPDEDYSNFDFPKEFTTFNMILPTDASPSILCLKTGKYSFYFQKYKFPFNIYRYCKPSTQATNLYFISKKSIHDNYSCFNTKHFYIYYSYNFKYKYLDKDNEIFYLVINF